MAAKKTWFTTLTVILFEICAAYALLSGIMNLGSSRTYPFLWYGGALIALAAVLLIICFSTKVLAHLKDSGILKMSHRQSIRAERLLVGAAILAGAAVRIWAIATFPITPASDYETYYRVAVLLSNGTLSSSGYSGYIAEFPHVIGFPFVLSLLFRLTGPSYQAGLYLNLAASLASAFIIYKIARRLGGRLCGFIALLAAACWPSQILYGAILASEPVFTFLILLCIWLFMYLRTYPVSTGNIEGSMFLCIILGVLLALAAAVRPLAQVFLVAAVISVLPLAVRFNINDKMLSGSISRAACQGWFRALVILLSFTICAKLVSFSISNAIAYKLPGGSVSYGYNLMVGVNIDAKGAWNQQDADFFAENFKKTNAASAAHQASLGVALQRIRDNPLGVLNLAFEKFTYLWENDDYGSSWTTLFLDQQGNLTTDRKDVIASLTLAGNCLYLTSIFLSGIYGLELLKKKSESPAQAMILLFIGTVVLHMALESQNRYHYFILPIFMILAASEAAALFRRQARKPGTA